MRTLSLAMLMLAGCIEQDERAANWQYIHAAIIIPSCATSNCHTNLGASPIGTSAGGIAFDDWETSYQIVTGSPCGEPVTGNIIIPGRPNGSHLMRLLRGDEVRRMPPDSPLPPAEQELIERWILEGAPCR